MQKRKDKEAWLAESKREKSKSPLIRHFSAGGAVYRTISNAGHPQNEWLLIKPSGTSRWQLPKGHIDQGEKFPETAVREVFEETGVHAAVQEKIGTIRYYYIQNGERIFKTVVYFLMNSKGEEPKIEDRWKHEIEEVRWVDEEQTLKYLTFKDERKILGKAQQLLIKSDP